jgi:hypothetical protein
MNVNEIRLLASTNVYTDFGTVSMHCISCYHERCRQTPGVVVYITRKNHYKPVCLGNIQGKEQHSGKAQHEKASVPATIASCCGNGTKTMVLLCLAAALFSLSIF